MTLHIEMVSDVVCPWCWLGLRRFKQAIALVPDIEVNVVFRPYELDPTIPAGGADYKDYMRQKFGSDGSSDRSKGMREALETYGRDEGVPYNFDAISRRPNSLNAHRLIHWAQGQNKGEAMKEALFQAFFADEQDIGDHETLVSLAAKVGLDANIVSDLLASDADVETVRSEIEMFRGMGVRGVPTFIANRALAASGAETPERLAEFLRKAVDFKPRERPATPPS